MIISTLFITEPDKPTYFIGRIAARLLKMWLSSVVVSRVCGFLYIISLPPNLPKWIFSRSSTLPFTGRSSSHFHGTYPLSLSISLCCRWSAVSHSTAINMWPKLVANELLRMSMGSNNFIADLPSDCSDFLNDGQEHSSSPAHIKHSTDRETLKYEVYFPDQLPSGCGKLDDGGRLFII